MCASVSAAAVLSVGHDLLSMKQKSQHARQRGEDGRVARINLVGNPLFALGFEFDLRSLQARSARLS